MAPGAGSDAESSTFRRTTSPSRGKLYLHSLGVVTICTAVAWIMFHHFSHANLIMVYLLGVVVVALRYGRGPALLASAMSVAAFDFFFVHPYFTFGASDTQYLLTLAVMLVVTVVISDLTARAQAHAEAAELRERRTAALYAMSRDLAGARSVEDVSRVTLRHMHEVFPLDNLLLLADANGRLAEERNGGEGPSLTPDELEVVEWVYQNSQPAGSGTKRFPAARRTCVPLTAPRGTIGVLGVRLAQAPPALTSEQLHLLETFANQTALAIERVALVEEAQQARMRVETERLRNALLSSVSHDLRTPLAAITGAASSLLEDEGRLNRETRRELTIMIQEQADRLARLVGNLLEMTRLEAGAVKLRAEWYPLEEVIGAALAQLERYLRDRKLITRLPSDLPLVRLDGLLIEQVLINLLDNAIKYSPPDSPIELGAAVADGTIVVEVLDRGPGLAPAEEGQVFEKFYRGSSVGRRGGAGLGLSICQGIIQAHGGHIWAENRPGGGAAFRFRLPLVDAPPDIRVTDD